MKRILLAMLVCFSALVSAQETRTLVIQNRTDHTLFLLVPADQELSPQSSYRQVPSGGLLPVNGASTVSGVAYQRGSFVLSTFAFSAERIAELSRSAAARMYLPVEDRHLTERSDIDVESFGPLLSEPRIDDVYLEWVAFEPAMARARNRLPVASYVDLGDGRQVLALEESLLWQRGGTDLEWVKGATGATDAFLAVASYSAFSDESSVFLYLISDDESPVATLELSPGRGNGFVFLWVPTELEPTVVGNLVSSEFFIEAQLWRQEIEAAIGADLLSFTAEIATANSAAGAWEEFLLARVSTSALFQE